LSILSRNNVHIRGTGTRAMIFAHGFGCDQSVWRFVAPSFEGQFVTVLFDHVGAGKSDLSAYSTTRYSSLHGYAEDVVQLGQELSLENAIFVGHSCSAMIGALASIKAPDMFERLVFVASSPRYVNDGDYVGGFTAAQIEGLLEEVDTDYVGWSARTAPKIMGNAERPELGKELANSFCRVDPRIARQFARVTFTSDNRADLPLVNARSLILQCNNDMVAPAAVGKFVHREILDSKLVFLRASGHCPHLSAPADTIAAINDFVASTPDYWFMPSRRLEEPNELSLAPNDDLSILLTSTRDRDALRDSLFHRAGELRMHLGRYDMYTVSLASMLLERAAAVIEVAPLTIHTRGADILRLMQSGQVSPVLHEQFRAIDQEIQVILDRQEIASHHGAAIAALAIAPPAGRPSTQNQIHDWYDHENATNAEIEDFIDAMDRDILQIVSLYVRVANCALALERANPRLG
jgi:sigma-B regulation protein RsbQ